MSIPYAHGTAVRTTPRLRIVSRDRRNTTETDIVDARVTSGTTIKSGQVVSIDPSTNKWVLGCAAGLEPFFALQDSTDSSVVSGTLSAISIASGAVIETAFFTGSTFNVGDVVGIDPTSPGTAGSVRVAESSDIVVGQVRYAGDASGTIVSGTGTAGVWDISEVNSETTAANARVIRIRLGNKAAVA